ncbi:hypothetical protein [Lapillicoccus sp.]|uniref:hypothetical protein n=1 Tax=Lapillicoccus sp. TaxID=1909287 RepID=UPI003264EBB2
MSERGRPPVIPPRSISPWIGVMYAVGAVLLVVAAVRGEKLWILVIAAAFAVLAWAYLSRALRRR